MKNVFHLWRVTQLQAQSAYLIFTKFLIIKHLPYFTRLSKIAQDIITHHLLAHPKISVKLVMMI